MKINQSSNEIRNDTLMVRILLDVGPPVTMTLVVWSASTTWCAVLLSTVHQSSLLLLHF